jgi:hypothetical protein
MLIKVKLTQNRGKQVGQITIKLKDYGRLSEKEILELCTQDKKFVQTIGNSYTGFQWSRNEFLQAVLDFTVIRRTSQKDRVEEERKG